MSGSVSARVIRVDRAVRTEEWRIQSLRRARIRVQRYCHHARDCPYCGVSKGVECCSGVATTRPEPHKARWAMKLKPLA